MLAHAGERQGNLYNAFQLVTLATFLSLFAPTSCVQRTMAAPPEGLPNEISFAIQGSAGYDGTYLLPWNDDDEGWTYTGDTTTAAVDTGGSGYVSAGGSDFIAFNMTFPGSGAYAMGDTTDTSGAFTGASASIPEPGGPLAAFFLISSMAFLQRSRRISSASHALQWVYSWSPWQRKSFDAA